MEPRTSTRSGQIATNTPLKNAFGQRWAIHKIQLSRKWRRPGSPFPRGYSKGDEWAMFWGGSRSTKPCVFPCKVASAGDERYLVCAAGRFGSFRVQSVPPLCSATSGCSCVRSSMRFLNLWLQIALEKRIVMAA